MCGFESKFGINGQLIDMVFVSHPMIRNLGVETTLGIEKNLDLFAAGG